VFQSIDAEEVERVLGAVLEPTRDRLLRAALATELMGCDAAAIEAIAGDEAALMERMLRFGDYREQWLRRGFGPCTASSSPLKRSPAACWFVPTASGA
jgi:exodeoxyribonuclease V beta subunit